MRSPRAPLLLVAGLSLVGSAAAPVRADGPEAAARIVRHRIEARFDPESHRITARDVVDVDVAAGRTFAFVLGAGIDAVTTTFLGAAEGTGAVAPRKGPPDGGFATFSTTLPEGVTQVEVRYSGTIFDAVEKKEGLSWVVGDATRGLISEKGIYLSGASGWYPMTERDEVAHFDVDTWVPAPFLVVTQGGIAERSSVTATKGWTGADRIAPVAAPAGTEPGTTWNRSVARAVIPTDDCSLSAGPYVTSSKEVLGVTVATWFLPGEAEHAPLWLDAAAEIVSRYEPILGTYPHPKFDVVENFFQTGYGMPSYTLLGDDVIRYVTSGVKASGGKIPPGYLDHEYVHGWFGNGVFVSRADGNWCEASTTYYSNYLAKEQESAAGALEHRRGVLEKYAIRVRGDKDSPVRSFRTKTEDKDNDIGYGKGSLVFHVLRKRLGDAEFFARVKRFTAEHLGKAVGWTEWLAALDGEWVRPYLERTGLPATRLASATAWPKADGDGWTVRAEVVVDQPRGEAPWPTVDLAVEVDGKPAGTVRVEGRSGVFLGTWPSQPKSLEVDPGYDALRRIADPDLPSCLNRTIETGKGVVMRKGGDKAFAPIAARFASEKGLEALAPGTLDAPAPARPAVRLQVIGEGDGWTWPRGAAKPEVSVSPGVIEIAGKRFEGGKHSILFSGDVDGVPNTWFSALSEEAAARSHYLSYYGWDQYVVFEAGKRTPVARGFLSRLPGGTRRDVATFPDAAVGADLVKTITFLASDGAAGRAPGTAGHAQVRTLLEQRLEAAGFAKAEVPSEFPLGVADLLSKRDLVLTTANGTEVLENAFRPLFNSAERDLGTPAPFGDANGVPLPGRVPDTSPEGLARFFKQLSIASPAALFVVPSAAAREGLAPFLDAPNALTPTAEAELGKPGRDGKPRPRPELRSWISGRRARAYAGATPLPLPVLLLEDAAYERLDRAPAVLKVDFAVKFGPERATWAAGKGGTNVVYGWMPPGLTAERPPVVVLSAHYDGYGTVDGVLHRGADDNGSGVACVLAAVEGLKEALAKGPGQKRGLIVCFFDGEEQGLLGSRALAPALLERFDVQAVVNVDSIGRVKNDEVHVIGLSKVPDLAGKASAALEGSGLRVGRDIDAFAFAEGSDHWPFHVLGVPAIDLWASDYLTMNSAADDLGHLDPVGVARLVPALRSLAVRLLTE